MNRKDKFLLFGIILVLITCLSWSGTSFTLQMIKRYSKVTTTTITASTNKVTNTTVTLNDTVTDETNATNANDVLKVVANPVSLNGGTIKDQGTNTVSTITSSVAIGTAAGTLTVAA